jgi:tetratricopeptide (TPR) repeat protein
MDNSEYIENYFAGTPDPDQVRSFERRIESDPIFAGDVAFYLSAHSLAGEIAQSEKKKLFREIYQKSRASESTSIPISGSPTWIKTPRSVPLRKWTYYISAAAVIVGICFGVYYYVKPVSAQQIAAQYELDHLKTLPVTMSARSDSIQTGLRLYNDGKLAEARQEFEEIIQSDSSDFSAKKYAGLASLQLKDYEKALDYFKQLETYSNLYSNPALFYQALTLMSRNRPGDKDLAKQLLNQVVKNDLEGKETAQEWLGKW